MASYEVSVNSFVEARITGVLGTVTAVYRNHTYCITLGGSEGITRDGYPCPVNVLPIKIYDFATRQYDELNKEYIKNTLLTKYPSR